LFSYLQLRVTGFSYVTVHIDLVVKHLVVLNDKTLEGSVFITIKLFHQVLRWSNGIFFSLQNERCDAFERNCHVLYGQVVLVNDTSHFLVVLELFIGFGSNGERGVKLCANPHFEVFLVRQELFVPNRALTELFTKS